MNQNGIIDVALTTELICEWCVSATSQMERLVGRQCSLQGMPQMPVTEIPQPQDYATGDAYVVIYKC